MIFNRKQILHRQINWNQFHIYIMGEKSKATLTSSWLEIQVETSSSSLSSWNPIMQILHQWPVKLLLITVSVSKNYALRFQYALTFLWLHLVINPKPEDKPWPTSCILQISFTASSDNQKSSLQGLHEHLNPRGKMNIIPNS